MRRLFQKIGKRIRRMWYFYLALNPVPETILPPPETPMLTDVESEYEVITWGGQRINLHKSQVKEFNSLNRDRKREVKENWRRMEKKGRVKFIEVNGKLICVQNKNYEGRTVQNAE